MSSNTWTPAALSAEATALSGTVWRLVEAQHHVSTLKLVDTLEEQALLERLIEDTKPPVPPECRHLHYLLATPFRYGTPYPHGSRFRRPGLTEGVFYSAETVATAIAEMAFHRLLFFAESPGTPWPANPAEYTAFSASFATGRAIDLTGPPLDRDTAAWTDPVDYAACQGLAEAARAAMIDVIRYRSVRDKEGIGLALLACRVFTAPEPTALQTWRIHLAETGVRAISEAPRSGLAFDREAFAADPRIAAMAWRRP
jgi:hypothetical protein